MPHDNCATTCCTISAAAADLGAATSPETVTKDRWIDLKTIV